MKVAPIIEKKLAKMLEECQEPFIEGCIDDDTLTTTSSYTTRIQTVIIYDNKGHELNRLSPHRIELADGHLLVYDWEHTLPAVTLKTSNITRAAVYPGGNRQLILALASKEKLR